MTEPPVSVHPLELTEAVPLLHALTDRVARDHDIRLLVIKGPIATAQGVRPARNSADLDVLVDPARVVDFREGLAGLGWTNRDASANAHVMSPHSVTYAHPSWPCEIDVHHHFPGFFADPQMAFDAIWARRERHRVAQVDVRCPDLIGQAAIVGLHSLRHPSLERSQTDLPHLAGALERLLDPAQRRELAELAAATGAADTLAPVLEPLGAPRIGAGSTSPEALESWRVQTSMADTHSVTWVSELTRSPVREWPRLLLRAVWLTEADIRVRQPGTGPGRRHLLLARLVRLEEGLRALPRAILIVRPWKRRPR